MPLSAPAAWAAAKAPSPFPRAALARLGNEVVVAHPGDRSFELDGVRFIPISTNPVAEFTRADIIISFRDIDFCGQDVLKNKRVVLWIHDDYSRFWSDFEAQRRWLPLINERVSRVFTIGSWQEKMFRRMFRDRLPEGKFFRTRNGIPFEFEEEQKVERGENRLIYTSVLNRGADFLPVIFDQLKADLPGLELSVCTSNPEEKELVLRDREDIRFLGKLNRADLRNELWRSTLLVYPNHPSPPQIGRFGFFAETCCISALEAQACGVPVVSSLRGGLPESVKNGETGLLIAGDPLSDDDYPARFSQAVKELIKDRDKLARFSAEARRFVMARFRWETIAQEWLDEFSKLLR